MKKIILLLLILLAPVLHAQTTTVSGQVTDTSSQSWNNGTYVISFNANGVGAAFTFISTGRPFTPPQPIVGSLNGGGSYSGVTLTSNTALTPAGSNWTFQFCPQATSSCYTENIVVSGSTQTVNATPPPPVITVNPVILPMAYADSEIPNPLQGTSYFNVTLQVQRTYTSSGWITTGSGGGSGSVQTGAQFSVVTYPNSGSNAVVGPSANCSPPTVQGQYVVMYVLASPGVVSPSCPQVGVSPRQLSGVTSDTILYSDNNNVVIHLQGDSNAIAETLPTPSTLNNSGFTFTRINSSSANDVITPAGGLTIQVNTSAAASSYTQDSGYACKFWANLTPDYNAYCWNLNGGGGGSGVSSFTGDGTLISNSGSTGGVTVTLENTGLAYGVFGSTSSSSGAPAYHSLSSYPTAAFPTLNQSTTGNAATATALSTTPSQCSGGQFATGIAASGNANCSTPSGSGTVTSFSSGNLSPLFTTSVATPTSTPALSFSLSNTGVGYGVFGNTGSSSGAPSFNALSSYPTAAFPTLNQNTTGNAATATNLSSYPTLCSGSQFSQGLSSGSNNCATPSGGSVSIVPGATVPYVDVFCGGGTSLTTGTIGTMGWNVNGTGATGGGANVTDVNHPCSYPIVSAATSGDEAALVSPNGWGYTEGNETFDSYFIFQVASVSNIAFYVGYCSATPCSTASDFIGARFDTSLSDTDVTFVTTNGGTSSTSTTNSFAPTASRWIKLRITSTTAGTILFADCEGSTSSGGCTLGTQTSMSTNVPTAAIFPVISVISRTSTAETLSANYFGFLAEGAAP